MLDLQQVEFLSGGPVIWILLHVLSTLEVSEYALVAEGHPNLVLLLVVVVGDFLILELNATGKRKAHA